MKQLDQLFWLLFIVMGIGVVTSTFFESLFIDIVLGIVIITLGINKLAIESSQRKITLSQGTVLRQISQIFDWLEQNHKHSKNLRDKTDFRFDKIHKKHSDIDEAVEDKFNQLSKNMFQIENKLKEISRALVDTGPVRSGRRKSL